MSFSVKDGLIIHIGMMVLFRIGTLSGCHVYVLQLAEVHTERF